jgi:hypothetical protein
VLEIDYLSKENIYLAREEEQKHLSLLLLAVWLQIGFRGLKGRTDAL